MADTALFRAAPALAVDRIDEAGFVQIGGIEQWIAIQDRDRANPVIVYLHGGPGEAQSPFLGQFKSRQRDFTVVNWDHLATQASPTISAFSGCRSSPAPPSIRTCLVAQGLAQHLARWSLGQGGEKLMLSGTL